jgi:hypothetical protein
MFTCNIICSGRCVTYCEICFMNICTIWIQPDEGKECSLLTLRIPDLFGQSTDYGS